MAQWGRQFWWMATAAGLLVGSGLVVWDPTRTEFVFCLFRRFVELPCPGCGLTRGTYHLIHGNLGAAMAIHPLAAPLVLQAVAIWALWGVAAFSTSRRQVLTAVFLERLVSVNAALLVFVWIGRIAVGDLAL